MSFPEIFNATLLILYVIGILSSGFAAVGTIADIFRGRRPSRGGTIFALSMMVCLAVLATEYYADAAPTVEIPSKLVRECFASKSSLSVVAICMCAKIEGNDKHAECIAMWTERLISSCYSSTATTDETETCKCEKKYDRWIKQHADSTGGAAGSGEPPGQRRLSILACTEQAVYWLSPLRKPSAVSLNQLEIPAITHLSAPMSYIQTRDSPYQ